MITPLFPLLLILVALLGFPPSRALAKVPIPESGLLDPGGLWRDTQQENLLKLRQQILEERGVPIYFVAIGAPDAGSAEEIAREFSTQWIKGGVGAVFVTFIDKRGIGLFVSEGEPRPREERIESARLLLFENRRNPDTAYVFALAAQELVSELPLLREGKGSGPIGPDGLKKSSDAPSEWTALYLAVGGLVALLVLAYLVYEAKHSNFFGFQRVFPSRQVPERLGGAYSGGHGMMIDFSAPRSAEKPDPKTSSEY